MIYLNNLEFISEYETLGINIPVSLEDVFPDEQIIFHYSTLDMTLNLVTPAIYSMRSGKVKLLRETLPTTGDR